MVLTDAITVIKGVGEETAKLFRKLGIVTIEDLLNYYPRRYIDYSNVVRIAKITPGDVCIKVSLSNVKARYVRAGLHITEAVASDISGKVKVVWFNQPYRSKTISTKSEYFLAGRLEFSGRGFGIVNPSIELTSQLPSHTARIIPVYRETKGLSSVVIRKTVQQCRLLSNQCQDVVPNLIQNKYKLIDLSEAVTNVHFPKDMKQLQQAKYRLSFNELFELIITGLYIKRTINKTRAPKIEYKSNEMNRLIGALPYTLTNAQKKVTWDILKNIQQAQPMNRLVEGDVGSGKTVVAALSSAMAALSGYQVSYMAPTELLARQHARTFQEIFKAINMQERVCVLTGGLPKNKKTIVYKAIQSGQFSCVIGTHALIQDAVKFNKLGLVIIDEQHRFGVNQRKKLLGKSNTLPHMLTMTATPIPRSLALVVYGELDVSLINEKPQNRKETHTEIVPLTERTAFYESLKKNIIKGEKCFVVCPLIEETDVIDARSVTVVHKELSKIFGEDSVGLLHGKMSSDEKQNILEKFSKSNIKILVSTTVIEVGLDIPDANIMIIESVERFGLAQLHQLRGRVGRGNAQGKCFLLQAQPGLVSPRIKAILSTNDGFKLAELDLKLRGPGAMYGLYQHGKIDLRIADFTDREMVEKVRQAAELCMSSGENLIQYPELLRRISQLQSVTNLN